ncbi:MAG: PilZ domain-containing protein [Endomicrobiales bacterium]|nr:PilZ domain-containing protein [Endomicrobiales bacterium]
MNEEKKIFLNTIFEFLIFIKKPIYISPSNNPEKKFKFSVESTLNNSFISKLYNHKDNTKSEIDQMEKLFNRKVLKVNIGYKEKFIYFETKLNKILNKKDTKNIKFYFAKPNYGIIKNYRPYSRIDISNENKYTAKLLISTQINQMIHTTQEIENISQQAIALYLNRKQGMVVPSDQVKSLKLYNKNKLLIDTQGKIIKVDTSNFTNKDNYMVVVKFDEQPESRDTSNIEKKDRESERISLLGEHIAYIDALHPILSDYHIYGQVIDISKTGIAFMVEKNRIPIMPGLIFHDFYIQFPYQGRLKISIKVCYCNEVTKDDNYVLKIGAEFVDISIKELNFISRAKQKIINSRLFDADYENSEDLWEFLFETGFIYQEKRKQIQKYSDSILDTNKKLLAPSPIFKSIIYKDDNSIKGYISAVKFYDNTWVVQHLTGKKTENAETGKVVFYAMMDYFLDTKVNQRVNSNFLTGIFRPNNLFSSIVLGDIKELINNRNIYDIINYDFCVLKEDFNKHNSFGDKYICKEANAEDLKELEKVLIQQGHFNMIRVEGLNYENILNLRIQKDFQKLGLYRYRRVFLVKNRKKENLAYAICEYSSPGINLSNLTNSFKIFPHGNEAIIDIKAINSLCDHVIRSYRETQMPEPVLLKTKNVPLPCQFIIKKQYSNYFLDNRYFPLFKSKIEFIFSNLKDFIRKHKNREKAQLQN